jgi:hypothetical protein
VEIPPRGDDDITETKEVGIVFVFFGEKVGDIEVTGEVSYINIPMELGIADSHVPDIDMAHLFVGTIVSPIDGTPIITPQYGRVGNIRHVEVREEMTNILCHLGAFIGSLDLRFAGATTDTGLTDDVPGEGTTSAGTDGTKKRAAFVKGDKSVWLGLGRVLGAPIGICISGEKGIVLGPTKGGGQVRFRRLRCKGNAVIRGACKVTKNVFGSKKMSRSGTGVVLGKKSDCN